MHIYRQAVALDFAGLFGSSRGGALSGHTFCIHDILVPNKGKDMEGGSASESGLDVDGDDVKVEDSSLSDELSKEATTGFPSSTKETSCFETTPLSLFTSPSSSADAWSEPSAVVSVETHTFSAQAGATRACSSDTHREDEDITANP